MPDMFRQKIEALARYWTASVYQKHHPRSTAAECAAYVEKHWREEENIEAACEVYAFDVAIAEQEAQRN